MGNIIVAIILILLATLLWWLSQRGYIQNKLLDQLDKIASILSFLLAVLLLVGSQANNSSNLNLESERQEVKEVIDKEIQAAVTANVGILKSIYAPDAIVFSRGGTLNDTSDDSRYQGWESIKQRYLKWWVFYSCQSMSLVDLSIEVERNRATATHRGVICDGKYNEDVTIYELEKIDGNWVITYLESGNK